MSNQRIKRELMSFEEATISRKSQIAAIVEVLESRDLIAKQDSYDSVNDLRSLEKRATG